MSAGNDQNEVWRLGPLPEPVSWAVGIFLALLIVALIVRVIVELRRDWAQDRVTRCRPCDLLDESRDVNGDALRKQEGR